MRLIATAFVHGEPKAQPRAKAFARNGRAGIYDPGTAEGWKGAIAAALQAEKLILMTDVPGVMKDKDDIDSLYRALDIRGCKDLMKEGIIYGGMTPKVWIPSPYSPLNWTRAPVSS